MRGFVGGLELSGLFYEEAVQLILDSEFPGLTHSAALIGHGSEVLGYDARNVAEGERPRSSRQRRSHDSMAPSSRQVRALLSAAQGTRYEALYVVAVHTGLRQGEILGLRWMDVDLDAGSTKLSVRRSLKVTDHGLDFGPPKNKASRRRIP